MTEFENLKNAYCFALQGGMVANVTYEEAKMGNEILHKFCEKLVDNSKYNEIAKQQMKNELKLLKETLSEEIETYYSNKPNSAVDGRF